jgi:hypothetical protein
MAEKQDQTDSTGTEVTSKGSADADHDEELDALLNSKNFVSDVTSMVVELAL